MNGPLKFALLCALLIAGALASYALGRAVRAALPSAAAAVPAAWAQDQPQGQAQGQEGQGAEQAQAAQQPKPRAEARRLGDEADSPAQVLLDGRPLFTIETPAGDHTPYERAQIAAQRLNDAIAQGAKPEDFRADVVQGLNVVLFRNQVIVTVDEEQAKRVGRTRAEVAEAWAAAIREALAACSGQKPEQPEQGPQQQAEQQPGEQAGGQPKGGQVETWKPPEPYGKKLMPIVSVGEGIQVGVAQVQGPKSRLKRTQAVALLETHFKKVLEIDIYVPITTKRPGRVLDRVQGVGVVAVGKYKLTGRP